MTGLQLQRPWLPGRQQQRPWLPGIPPQWREDYLQPAPVPRATIGTLKAVLLCTTMMAARPEKAA